MTDRIARIAQDLQEYYANNTQISYGNATTALFFNPLLQQNLRLGYGSMLVSEGTDKAKKYAYGQNPESSQIQKGARKFLRQYKDTQKQVYQFKNVIRTYFDNAKSQIRNFTLEEISLVFPWVMSNAYLFQPLRSLIYLATEGILTASSARQTLGTVNPSMINKTVNQGIYRSVKYNAPFLNLAITALSDQSSKVGIIRKALNGLVTVLTGILPAVGAGLGFVARKVGLVKLVNTIVNGLKWLVDKTGKGLNALGRIFLKASGVATAQDYGKNGIQQQGIQQMLINYVLAKHQASDVYKLAAAFGQSLVVDLRCYGSVVINFGVINQYAHVRYLQGGQFYYFPQKPEIMFGLKNSMCTVYQFDGTNANQIPEGIFNREYLKSMLIGQAAGLTGRIISDIDRQITLTDDQKQGLRDFKLDYLATSNVVSKDGYGQLSAKLKQKNKKYKELYDKEQYKLI